MNDFGHDAILHAAAAFFAGPGGLFPRSLLCDGPIGSDKALVVTLWSGTPRDKCEAA
jgi:hypothetical protein